MSDPLSEHILRTALEKPDDLNPLNVLNRINAYESMAHRAQREGDTGSAIAFNEEANSLRYLYKQQVKAGVQGWKFWKDLKTNPRKKRRPPFRR